MYIVEREMRDDIGTNGLTHRRRVRRKIGKDWLTRLEVEREQVNAYRHPYHSKEETIAQQIDAKNVAFQCKDDAED